MTGLARIEPDREAPELPRLVRSHRRELIAGLSRLPHIPRGKPSVGLANRQPSHSTSPTTTGATSRTGLTHQAIATYNDNSIALTFRDSHDPGRKSMTLPPYEFLRRFLQHVPLKDLHRVRAYRERRWQFGNRLRCAGSNLASRMDDIRRTRVCYALRVQLDGRPQPLRVLGLS